MANDKNFKVKNGLDVGDTTTITSSGTIGLGTAANGYLQITDETNTLAFDPNEIYGTLDLNIGTAAGDIDLRPSTGAIKVYDGTNEATLSYTKIGQWDSAYSSLANYLLLAGGTLTGNLGLETELNPKLRLKTTDTTITTDQVISTIEFIGAIGVGSTTAGHIQQVATEDWAAGAVGSDMVFSINVGDSFDEKLRLNSDGVEITGTITATDYNATNWDTAYTYSQVGHLPLAGGTLTGALTGTNITAGGYLQAHSYLYTRDNLRVLNAAETGWTTWGTRTAGNYNLSIGTLDATGALTGTSATFVEQISANGIVYPLTIAATDVGNTVDQVVGDGVGLQFKLADNVVAGGSFLGASIAATRVSATDSDSETSLDFYVSNNDETLDKSLTLGSALNAHFRGHITQSSGSITAFGNVEAGLGHVKSQIGYLVGTTTVIDSSRNLTNIGTISSGAITTTGNLLLTGDATATNAARTIDFTGFDKEGVDDFTDRAYIQHTTNTGGHAGSVLVISSQNDAGDGIAFQTNASSELKHNSNTIWTAGNLTNNQANWNTAYGWGDHSTAGYASGSFLPLSGGTLTGNLGLETELNPKLRLKTTDTTITTDQVISTIEFIGAIGVGSTTAGHIQQVATEDWAAGAVGSDMVFSINVGNSFDEKLRLNSDGVEVTGDLAVSSGSITATNLAATEIAYAQNIGHAQQDILFAITDHDTTESIRNKFEVSSLVSKVDDPTAPASGIFEVTGYLSKVFGPYIPVSDDTEIMFETWVKYVSGGDASGDLYVGGNFYNGSKTDLGNNNRYWGANGDNLDSNEPAPAGEWHHIKGILKGSAIRGIASTSTAEYVRLLVLLNYNANANTTRYCGFKFYQGRQTVSSLYHKRHNTTDNYSDTGFTQTYGSSPAAFGAYEVLDSKGALKNIRTITSHSIDANYAGDFTGAPQPQGAAGQQSNGLYIKAGSSSNDNSFKIDNLAGSQIAKINGFGQLTLAGSISATGYNNGNWNTAYGWGDHSTAGYLTSSGFLPLAGGTLTGKLTLNDAGYSLGNEYHKWKRAYTVNTSSPQEILYSDGNSLPTGGVYRFTAHISATGTDQFATAVYWNQNGTWRINVTGQSGTSSNNPEFIIDATTNKPTIHIDHASSYGIHILGERIELDEGTGTDNAGFAFGTDAFLGSVNNNLYFLPGGTAATGQNSYDDGSVVWHTGNLTTTNKSNYDTAYTYSQVGHLPLAGGTLTGNLGLETALNPKLRLKTTDTTITTDQVISTIEFIGAIGVGSTTAGHIQQVATEDWAAGAVGSDMVFSINVGSSFDEKLRLNSDGVEVTGALTTDNSLKVTGVASSNSSPAADQVELSGYGLIGNRGNVYLTNSNANGQIVMGISGAHNANPRLTVTTSGITVGGTVAANGTVSATGGNSTNWNTAYGWGDHSTAGYLTSSSFLPLAGGTMTGDLTIPSKIIHSGDTNTYMQFHAADQWRVVTGGTERLEVSNTAMTSTLTITAPAYKVATGGATLGRDPGNSVGSMWIALSAADKSFAVSDGNSARFLIGGTVEGEAGTGVIESRRQHKFDPVAATISDATATMISKGSVTTTTGYQPQNWHMAFQDGGGTVRGKITSSHYSTQYSTSSDYRLKEDIQPIANATARLLAIEAVNFRWIDGQQRSDGFIAHELQEHLPEAVTGEKDATEEVTETVVAEDGTESHVTRTIDALQGVDQSKLVPLLVKTIQELEARITALENA